MAKDLGRKWRVVTNNKREKTDSNEEADDRRKRKYWERDSHDGKMVKRTVVKKS